MNVVNVARKDFTATRRTKTLWIIIGVFTFLAGTIAYVYDPPSGADAPRKVSYVLRMVSVLVSIVVPIVTLMSAYLAIAGERETGGIKFTLSLPNSRGDLFFGKLLSRQLVVCLGVVAMFVVATVVAAYRFETVSASVAVGLLGLSVAYALVYVSITIATSAALRSRSRAIAAAIGVYFVTVIMYVLPQVQVGRVVAFLHQDVLRMTANVDLYRFAQYTSPFLAYQKAKNLVVPESLEVHPFVEAGQDPNMVEYPFFLTDEFSLVIFAVWLSVPLVLGYVRFQRADIA